MRWYAAWISAKPISGTPDRTGCGQLGVLTHFPRIAIGEPCRNGSIMGQAVLYRRGSSFLHLAKRFAYDGP
jgi:hypothetical protein